MEETTNEYSYADWFVAAKKAADAIFDKQTDEEIQEVFSLSKEVYSEGAEAVSLMSAKIEAIGKILISMAQRIGFGEVRDLDDTSFSQVVNRALKELNTLNEGHFK